MEKGIQANLHLLSLTPFYPSLGDETAGCFVAEPLQQLSAQGIRSSVIAVHPLHHRFREKSQAFPAEWIRYPTMPGNFGLASAGSVLGRCLSDRVREIHITQPIDIIHAHAALPCGTAAASLSRLLDIPFVVTVHGLDVFNTCLQDGVSAAWRRRASLHVYENAAKVICISQKVRQILVEGAVGLAAASALVYNGTDTDRFFPTGELNGDPTLLAVGNLIAEKGHDLLFRAVEQLTHSYPGLTCSIIGDGVERERLNALAAELGIRDQVRFLGKRTRSEVATAMRNCSVFVLPSRYEGLGCVYLEAMASGKPVIACHGQGIDEIIVHKTNGWLIPVDGLEELVEGVHTLLCDNRLRARIGQAARETIVENLTLSHQAQRLLEVYQDAMRACVSCCR